MLLSPLPLGLVMHSMGSRAAAAVSHTCRPCKPPHDRSEADPARNAEACRAGSLTGNEGGDVLRDQAHLVPHCSADVCGVHCQLAAERPAGVLILVKECDVLQRSCISRGPSWMCWALSSSAVP